MERIESEPITEPETETKTESESKTMTRLRDFKFGNNVIEKSFKILHLSVSLEMFLLFWIRLIFSTFKGLSCEKEVYTLF